MTRFVDGGRLARALQRRLARWTAKRLFNLDGSRALVSFTFDDFPRSAIEAAGDILSQHGQHATYFVSMGLVGRTIATGEMFSADDLVRLLECGHELGCHTYHHHPAWETAPGVYESSVRENAGFLAALPGARRVSTHSYPISYPRPSTKRRLGRRFRACRGGGQTFNRGVVDLNYLSSFFIEQSVDDFSAIERLIAANSERRGWLIFSTHDVCKNHSRFGCSPTFFRRVVDAVRRSGAEIVTMNDALETFGVPMPAAPVFPA